MSDTSEWSLRDWADHAIGQLPTVYLERYVEGFEAGTLRHCCSDCAVGHMGGGGADAYVRLREEVTGKDGLHKHFGEHGEQAHPLAIVEAVFEGIFCNNVPGVGDMHFALVNPETRRRTLYESCVEELARRESETVEREAVTT